ncbi:ABC transporter ATP-binding protein [Enterococcus ureilyticus]|uniref:ABC transporter ATP-binding protein n=1 Tax=Enterococcus ureilyticus TaxID=1131292 RepID=UPI001A916AA2|nr:ABC transporter ATP-binding protein [Enterococcus ureilyticus]MBO0445356.1 ABC transporter ATP-binding protein [Enterococcus ureilyticus]
MIKENGLIKTKVSLFKTFNYKGLIKRKLLLFSGLLCLLLSGSQFLFPLLYKSFINEVILEKKIAVLPQLLLLYVVAYVVKSAINMIYFKVSYKNAFALVRGVKELLWKKEISKSLSALNGLDIEDKFINIEADTRPLYTFLSEQIEGYIVQLFTAVAAILLLFLINLKLGFLALIVSVISIVVDGMISKAQGKMNLENRENDRTISNWIKNSVYGWKDIKAFGMQNFQMEKFSKLVQNYASYHRKWTNLWVISNRILPRVKNEFIAKFSLYFLGGLLIIQNEMTVGSLLVFISYFNFFLQSINQLTAINNSLNNDKPYYANISAELNTIQTILKVPQNERILENIDSIEFENISFSYNHKPVLNNCSFVINRGDKVAIIGNSGSGKSTLMKLLAGIVFPDQGRILLSGNAIKEIGESTILKRIGFVFQDANLFSSTIEENLFFGLDKKSRLQHQMDIEKSNLLTFVQESSAGYERNIGDKGMKLSGGQKQRLMIARQVVREIEVLVLDEATNSLDLNNERGILSELDTIWTHISTLIIISHRRSTIEKCNRFLKVVDGKVIELDREEALLGVE